MIIDNVRAQSYFSGRSESVGGTGEHRDVITLLQGSIFLDALLLTKAAAVKITTRRYRNPQTDHFKADIAHDGVNHSYR